MGNEMSQDGEGGVMPSGPPGPGPPRGMVPGQGPMPQFGSAPRPMAQRAPGTAPIRFQTPQQSSTPPYMAPVMSSTSMARSPSQGMHSKPSSSSIGPHMPPPRSASGPAISMAKPAAPPDLDLSNLSKEEREIIESVMARAQGMTPEPNMPPKESAGAVIKSKNEPHNVDSRHYEAQMADQEPPSLGFEDHEPLYGMKPQKQSHISANQQQQDNRKQQQQKEVVRHQQKVLKCLMCQTKEVEDNGVSCYECQGLVCLDCAIYHTGYNQKESVLCDKCFKKLPKSHKKIESQPEKIEIQQQGFAKNDSSSNKDQQHQALKEESRIVVPPGKSKTLSQNNHIQEKQDFQVKNIHSSSEEENEEIERYMCQELRSYSNYKDHEDRYDILDDDDERYMHQDDLLEDMEDSIEESPILEHVVDDSDEDEDMPHHMLQPMPYYDHSPGEVYTIPEEEEENTIEYYSDVASDTVSSLRKWTGMDPPYEKYMKAKENYEKFKQIENEENRNQDLKSNDGSVKNQSTDRPKNLELSQLEEEKFRKEVESARSVPNGHKGQQKSKNQILDKISGQSKVKTKNCAQNVQNLVPNDTNQRVDESSSPEFAASGAGMAISNLLASQEKQFQMQSRGAMPGGLGSTKQGSVQVPTKSKPKGIDLASQLQQAKPKSKPQKPSPAEQDWSPVTDLSPIMDVSPSVEQAEQELIENYNEKKTYIQQQANVTRATSGTISGMLADFSKALGLGKAPGPNPSPEEDKINKTNNHIEPVTKPKHAPVASETVKDKKDNAPPSNVETSEKISKEKTDEVQSIPEQQQSQKSQLSTSSSQQQPQDNKQNNSKQADGEEKLPQQQQQQKKEVDQTEQPSAKQPNSKKVHRKLPQPTVEQMQAALASSASSRQKSSSKSVAIISASGVVTNTVSTIPPNGEITVPRRTVPQMGTNVMKVEGMQHRYDYNPPASSIMDTSSSGYLYGTSPKNSSAIMTSVQALSSPRITAVSPYRVVDNSIPRFRSDAKQISPNSSPDDYYLKPTHMEMKKTPTSSAYIGSLASSPGLVGLATSITGMSSTSSKERLDADTQSETDSCKSGKIRRRLPPIPQDQSPSPVPIRKNRAKSMSSVSRQAYQQPILQQQHSTPHPTTHQISKEELATNGVNIYNQRTSLTRPSASETNLQLLGMEDDLKDYPNFQSGVSRSKVLSGSESNIYSGVQFPTYIRSLKDQLKEELKIATDARRKLIEGTEDSSISSHQRMKGIRTHRRQLSDPNVQMFSSLNDDKSVGDHVTSATNNLRSVPLKSYEYESLSRTHEDPLSYKHLNDRIDELTMEKVRETSIDSMRDHNVLEDTYKSLGLRRYHTLDREDVKHKMQKRNSMGASLSYDPWGRDASGAASNLRKHDKKLRKPRSWHPSPYVSEDEDDQMSREEKKMTIKAEIARRRMQIEENARLHEQLLRLAKSRDGPTAEYYTSQPSSGMTSSSAANYYYTSPRSYESMSTGSSRSFSYSSLSEKDSSILKSIDEILKKDYGGVGSSRYGGDRATGYSSINSSGSYYEMMSAQSSSRGSLSPAHNYIPQATAEELSMQRIASTFGPDPRLNRRASDFSPMTTDTDNTPPLPLDFTPAMPLLPDLPTKSRKLLEDLGSKPIATDTGQAAASSQVRTSKSGTVEEEIYERESKIHNSRRNTHHHNEHQNIHPRQVSNSNPRRQRIVQDVPEEQPFSDHTRRSSGSNLQSHHHQQSSSQQRKAHASSVSAQQKYEFPVKRYLLTRDPKDRSVSGNGLGMKVIGGKEIPGNRGGELGAYVAKIYSGGVVDRLAEIKQGDQIIEWNGTSLVNKTYEAVQTIISIPSEEVELLIRCDFTMSGMSSTERAERTSDDDLGHYNNRSPRRDTRLVAAEHHQDPTLSSSMYEHRYHSHSSQGSSRQHLPYDPYDSSQPGSSSVPKNSISTPSLSSQVDRQALRRVNSSLDPDEIGEPQLSIINNNHIPSAIPSISEISEKPKNKQGSTSGEIQLQVCLDSQADILYITILRAKNLVSSRTDRSSQAPDPFVKCYLLPGRCVENQRRTRYFSRSFNPEWKQTMVYPNVTLESLNSRYLEVTVWNYDIYRPNEFLGEVILDLSDRSVIDEQTRWYKLLPHDETKRPSHILPSSSSNVTMATLSNLRNAQSSESSLSGLSLNGVVGKRMAMVNNRSTSEESKKNFEKKYKSMGRRKSGALSLSPTHSHNRLKKVPIFPTSNVTAHPLMPQGCHGAVCTII